MDRENGIPFESIPLPAAEDYDKNRSRLIAYVDDVMTSRDDILSLVGKNGIDMMKINHMNHAAFMTIIFLLNRFSLLEITLPWVYRAYHNHGFSYDYFPIELNAWIDAVHGNLQPVNAEPVINVYRWIINRHEKNIETSLMWTYPVYRIDNGWIETYELFLGALIKSDTYKCSEIAFNSCKSETDIKAFYVNVAQPALYRIGDLWESGDVTVAMEHLATAIVSRTISQLSFLYKPVFNQGKRVMVLCISGENHHLGALMVANCFEMDDWNVNFIAESLPFSDTMQHLAAFKPHLLAISVTMPHNIFSMIELIKKIKSGVYHDGMKILAGGQAFKLFPDLPEILGADAYAKDCYDAVITGRNLAGINL
ncbi:MAG TPA: cobalamin B12-binding domain-containing protein [Spirochaetota bacterium]|nr:cobalamin B12-binding domain-containing protein [Spirochaetota bacterium]